MNPQPNPRLPEPDLEDRLRRVAQTLHYPSTPDVAGAVARRLATGRRSAAHGALRLAWVTLVALLILLLGLWAVPPVRAVLLDFLQIGAVRIWLVAPTPTPTTVAATASADPTPTPLTSVLDLAGETTLAAAQAKVAFPIRLPAYPADLGAPDKVYWQNLDGPAVILVWLKPEQPNTVRLSLQLLSSKVIAGKMGPKIIATPHVHDQIGLWLEGPYIMVARNGDWDMMRLIEGHVLVWAEGDITYRLETDLPLEEAVRIAESLP